MAMSSCDKFDENTDSITMMETRVKAHCTSWQERKVAWSRLCCSVDKGYVPDTAGVSDADLYLEGQGLPCQRRDGYGVC